VGAAGAAAAGAQDDGERVRVLKQWAVLAALGTLPGSHVRSLRAVAAPV
jgi:hypothetical protein